MSYDLQYKPFGNQAVLIEWPSVINEAILKDIVGYKTLIVSNNEGGVEDVIIGYNSLTIKYNGSGFSFNEEVKRLKAIYLLVGKTMETPSVTWQIPVCYDLLYGIDLEAIANDKNTTVEAIVNLHSRTIYTVFFIGFLPGFLYLGGLDKSLFTKRKATPRLNVAKGAVAIGGGQTGVYPDDSAGGWNIIGQTPVSFFDIKKANPCFAKSGDKVQFVSITKDTFLKIEAEEKLGLFKLKSVVND